MLGDIFTGGFFSATSAGILATMPSAQITVNAMDFTVGLYNSFSNPAKNSFSNALEIEFGGFTGSFKQILSRWTWELPQTMLGNTYSHYINLTGKVDNVSFYGGATVLKCYGDEIPMGKGALGVTLGSYIIGNNQIAADPNNSLFQHEYGHYLRSRESGPGYYFEYGIPSLWSAATNSYDHDYFWIERDANKTAFIYFTEQYPGFNNWFHLRNPLYEEGDPRNSSYPLYKNGHPDKPSTLTINRH